jgi:acid phosphatase
VPKTPPATLKNLIVILEENENYGNVQGSAALAPYINSLAAKCGVATAYNDNCFSEYLESLPHYLALTSGSNCDTGNDQTGTSCITADLTDTTQGTLSTVSIFQQVASWKSYQEDMPSACDQVTPSSGEYVLKHNPAALYTNLTSTSSCTNNDLAIAALTCATSTTMTSCGTPSNAFTQDLANDTLAQFTFVTPDLLNDMHDGTITEADNWLYTYLPLVFASPAYLRGDVGLFILWDQQEGISIDGPTPNVFISPYITAGTSTATVVNHFASLRATEEALGITTFLGCASGTPPGGTGTCPSGSTAELRQLINF